MQGCRPFWCIVGKSCLTNQTIKKNQLLELEIAMHFKLWSLQKQIGWTVSYSILIMVHFTPILSVSMGGSRKYPYHTTDGFKDFRRGGGIHDYGILKAWGGIYDLKSEGMGEFHRWDFWSRKCRVSSWKTLLLWTFVVRK